GHSKPKELLVFESYIVEAEEGSEKKIKWWAWLLLRIGPFSPLASCYIIDKKLHIRANVLHGSSHCDSRGCSSSTDNTIHEVQKQVVTVCVNKSFEAIWTTCSEVSRGRLGMRECVLRK
ncbi:hypothetical protein Tco_1001236, partial [Tanacetum coccineum]